MTEEMVHTPTLAEDHEPSAPGALASTPPFYRVLLLVRWLQLKLRQLLSRLHLLSLTRGRSIRGQRLVLQVIQAGGVLLFMVSTGPLLPATARPISPPPPRSAAHPQDTISFPSSSTNPSQTTLGISLSSLNPLAGVDVGTFSAPSFADLDGDGDLDAYVGEKYGYHLLLPEHRQCHQPGLHLDHGQPQSAQQCGCGRLQHPQLRRPGWRRRPGRLSLVKNTVISISSKNTGSAISPVFSEQTGTLNPLNGVEVSSGYSTPSFADVDARWRSGRHHRCR